MLARILLGGLLLAVALAAPWAWLLHTALALRATHAAVFLLILFAVFRLPVLLVRRQRAHAAAPRRRAASARKGRKQQGAARPPASSFRT